MPAPIPASIVETIIALHQSHDPPLSSREIARHTKTSERSVRKYLADREIVEKVGSSRSFALIKKGISEKFYRLSNDCLDLAGKPEKIERMTSYQLVGMSGILHQNARLAAGESTQNIGIAAVIAEATRDRMEKE